MGKPFTHSGSRTNWHMQQVLWAMIPGIILLTIFFGRESLLNLFIASMSALCFEALILALRGRPIGRSLCDGSALITAWLIAVSVPATLSPIYLIVGVFFAIVVGKQLYGGLGHNLFNPAMIAYVVLLISFPLSMSQWPEPNLSWLAHATPDAISQATPLDRWHSQKSLVTWNLAWVMINVGWMFGGLYLLIRGLIAWQTVLGFLLILGVATALSFGFSINWDMILLQFFSGGTMLAAFFIITDPVTSATTPLGRLIFGAGVALFTFLIRLKGGYPDGIAFSVLLMNCTVPLLDQFTTPRVFGHGR